ncbi:ATP-dependent RNA helicase DHX58-like isoform X3 [Acropora muricata]|uniref:ATP-dependent RNA helicase DHX58-like isoform X3 n=1 Tax=Acropora muricata TaxID=159855 RepID=UPI0034E3FF9F
MMEFFPNDDADDDVTVADGSGLTYKMIGTAIDLPIRGNLMPAGACSEEQTEECSRLEESVAERYKDRKSDDNKRMRGELQKRLPQGVVFVNTEKGSIISTFRLSSEKAAKELWEMYSKGSFQSMLQEVLVGDAVKHDAEKPEESLQLQLNLGEERFEKIRKKLEEIERDQERENMLSLSSEGENGSLDDSADEIDIEIPPVFLGTKANAIGGCELVLRKYQKELAGPAMEGKNTIICAPTNSGKTYVAIEIAKRHLDSYARNPDKSDASGPTRKPNGNDQPRVVFIVSTVNLVLQQKERFEAFLGDKYSVADISGTNCAEIPLKFLLQNNDVVVMTAMILVNALKATEKGNRVELRDISLLLFDECHHAHKDHPYNSIMEMYLALKSQAGHQQRLPQIVGLTASLGTGKAKSAEKAKEHIILVSANLDAQEISTVKENREELEQYVNLPSKEQYFVPKDEQDPFENIISKVMKNIEAQINKFKGKSGKDAPSDKAGQQYRQWVEEVYKDSVAGGDRYMVTYAEHLREYHIALTLNSNTRMKNAREYLTKYFEALDTEKFTETDKNLKKLFFKAMAILDKHIEKDGEPENPRLLKLQELLLDNYKDVERQQDNKDESGKKEVDGGSETEGRRDLVEENNKSCAQEQEVENEKVKNDAEKKEEDRERENEACATVLAEDTEKLNGEVSKENPSLEKTEELPPEAARSDHASTKPDDNQNILGESELEDSSANEKSEVKSEKDDAMPEQESQNNARSTSSEGTENDEGSSENGAHHPEWDGAKGILFTRTRESTIALFDWINETEELSKVLRPELLVGSGDGNIGMTQKEQEGVIKRFKTGERNILLATSVAEEGLDISDCNYVIRYDMMGNEISSMQSRGRVRAKDGKYTVLVSHTAAKKRDINSQFREMLMIDALSRVQKMDKSDFIKTVKEVQRKISQERFLKKHVRAAQKSVVLADDVNFKCRKCKEFVCQAHDVRRIKGSHHVIINRECRDTKVDMKEHRNPKKIDDIEMNKKIFCKKCHEDWGVTALIYNVEWLCIKISSFVLEFPGRDTTRMYKKWKDLPFAIQEADEEEILRHGADNSEATDLFDLES